MHFFYVVRYTVQFVDRHKAVAYESETPQDELTKTKLYF